MKFKIKRSNSTLLSREMLLYLLNIPHTISKLSRQLRHMCALMETWHILPINFSRLSLFNQIQDDGISVSFLSPCIRESKHLWSQYQYLYSFLPHIPHEPKIMNAKRYLKIRGEIENFVSNRTLRFPAFKWKIRKTKTWTFS